jgi:hypothetical protein
VTCDVRRVTCDASCPGCVTRDISVWVTEGSRKPPHGASFKVHEWEEGGGVGKRGGGWGRGGGGSRTISVSVQITQLNLERNINASTFIAYPPDLLSSRLGAAKSNALIPEKR